MNKLLGTTLLFFLLGTILPALAAENGPALPDRVVDVRYEKCPVMGGKPKEDVTLLRDGRVYHFCCPGCNGKFDRDFATRSTTIVNPTEVSLTITNIEGKCPVSGKPADAGVFRIKGDSITFFCCKDCIARYQAPQEGGLPPAAPAGGAAPGGHGEAGAHDRHGAAPAQGGNAPATTHAGLVVHHSAAAPGGHGSAGTHDGHSAQDAGATHAVPAPAAAHDGNVAPDARGLHGETLPESGHSVGHTAGEAAGDHGQAGEAGHGGCCGDEDGCGN